MIELNRCCYKLHVFAPMKRPKQHMQLEVATNFTGLEVQGGETTTFIRSQIGNAADRICRQVATVTEMKLIRNYKI